MNTARQAAEITGFATSLFLPVPPRRLPDEIRSTGICRGKELQFKAMKAGYLPH
jgi:hypothetical protein